MHNLLTDIVSKVGGGGVSCFIKLNVFAVVKIAMVSKNKLWALYVCACVCLWACVCAFNVPYQTFQLATKEHSQETMFKTFFQGMLHVVSFNTMKLYKIDITSDSLLYVRKFPSGQPYTINVYDTESTTSFKGKQYMFYVYLLGIMSFSIVSKRTIDIDGHLNTTVLRWTCRVQCLHLEFHF